MPLSEYEQRVLEQMERQLSTDDPKLASTLHGRGPSRLRVWLLAGFGGLAGLGMLLGGVASGLPWLGVLGFVLMFGAVLLLFSAPGRGPAKAPAAGSGKGPTRAPAAKAGLFTRLEERWEKRRGEQR